MRHAAARGAVVGLAAGLLVLAGVFAVSLRCLPYRITYPPPPWPWTCSDPAFVAIGYLAFPVNLLTNDLSRAARLAPLTLSLYAIIGALVGLSLDRLRRSSAGR